MQFAFEEPSFDRPLDSSAADRLRRHAAEVIADLAGAREDDQDSLPQELPVEAAVACGNCRLYGGVAPQVVFPAWLATTAARRLVVLLRQAAGDATRLPELWDDYTGDEAEDLVAGLLHARMDAWAARLQLEDVLEHCADEADRGRLEAAFGDLESALDAFDRALFTRQDYLALLAGTHLLANLRGMLAANHREPMPWWLDGRLESRDAEIDAETDRLLHQTLFETGPEMAAVPRPTIADLKAEAGLVYAAAAAAEQMHELSILQRIRWRSPAGDVYADFVPAPSGGIAAEQLVFDFTDSTGAPAIALLGQRCSLAGVEAVVSRQDVEGEIRATATFPATAFFGSSARVHDDSPLTLVVGVPGTEWAVQWV